VRVVVAGAGFAGLPGSPAAYLSRIEVTHGVAARTLAAAAVADVTGGFTRRPCWRVAGGNQQVASGLAGRLRRTVRLRCAVRSVEHGPDGVRVLTDDGELSGDAVIAAVSAVQSVPDRFWTWTATDGSGQVQPVLHSSGGTDELIATPWAGSISPGSTPPPAGRA
jgi:phytoene dehydrogenase-like protein